MFGVVHFLYPTERVCGFEFFGDAAIFYQLGESEIDLSPCLLLGFVEVLIERAQGEKRGVGAAAVLFEIVEAYSAVLAKAINNHLNAQIVIGVCDLLYYASNIIDERIEDYYSKPIFDGIDKKQRRETQAKKNAQGHTMSW